MIQNFNEYLIFFNQFSFNYFALSFALLVFGLISLFLNKDNFVKILMSFELIVLANILNFSMCSSIHNDITSQVFVIIILTIAAAESAIGLAIFFAYFKKKKSVAVKDANLLKG
jgi:NADH-quinone oxidoreductase subunit K